MLARIHFFKLLYFILGYSQLKGTTEEEMVEWYHQFNGRKFEQTWGVCEGQEAWQAAIHGVRKCWT